MPGAGGKTTAPNGRVVVVTWSQSQAGLNLGRNKQYFFNLLS